MLSTICFRIEARGQGHSDLKNVCDLSQPQDVSNKPNLGFLGDKPLARFLELKPEVKDTVPWKQYVTLYNPKMSPYNKYGIPTSNNTRYALDRIFLEQRSRSRTQCPGNGM